MNRIILIGNGFDLAHGLKTSYANFINWYWEYWGHRLLRGLKKMDTDGLCSFIIKDSVHAPNWASVFQGWYYRRENPFIPWHLKEVIKLAKEDKDLCDFTMSPFLERICKSIETKKWVDIENEYYELLKKFALEENNETKVEELNQQLHTLQDRLVEYLSEINKIEVESIESIKSAIYDPFKSGDISIGGRHAFHEHIMSITTLYSPEKRHLPNRILLLNFNYTKTAELYCSKDMYTIIINQIHGEVAKPESVIFGYGDEMDEKYKEIVNKNDNHLLGNIKSIKYLETDNYRKMLEFIESDSYQVCIMGHSCGNSDRTLLNTLFEHRNCVSVKPYYHKKEDGTDNYLDLVQNISRNFNDMKLMRDRVVNKVYCKPLTEP